MMVCNLVMDHSKNQFYIKLKCKTEPSNTDSVYVLYDSKFMFLFRPKMHSAFRIRVEPHHTI